MTQGVMTPPNPPSSPSTASSSGVARCWHSNAYFRYTFRAAASCEPIQRAIARSSGIRASLSMVGDLPCWETKCSGKAMFIPWEVFPDKVKFNNQQQQQLLLAEYLEQDRLPPHGFAIFATLRASI
jgi:hypothetical protein